MVLFQLALDLEQVELSCLFQRYLSFLVRFPVSHLEALLSKPLAPVVVLHHEQVPYISRTDVKHEKEPSIAEADHAENHHDE